MGANPPIDGVQSVLHLRPSGALMSNADLTQYNGTQAFPATADVGTNADPYLTPTDGFKITALSNLVNEAPVNVSLKRIKDLLLGLRGATIGDFAFASRKTFHSLVIDGIGGAVSTAVAGTILSTLARAGTALPTTANPAGVITADSPVFGFASFSWSGAAYAFTGGFNVDSIVNPVVGTVVVSFATAPTNYLKATAIGTGCFNSGASYVSEATAGAPVGGKMPVTVYIRANGTGAAIDAGFSIVVFAGAGA